MAARAATGRRVENFIVNSQYPTMMQTEKGEREKREKHNRKRTSRNETISDPGWAA